ncbi:MAG: 30S ribosomal protein S20 [Patescibacteria group bacterium]|jgi:small subunit ribosomal protein S20
MPIKKAAEKALRQTKKRTARNLKIKETIAFLRRSIRKATETKDVKKAEQLVKSLIQVLDKAVQNRVIKLNTGSRTKSRLVKGLNKLKKQ